MSDYADYSSLISSANIKDGGTYMYNFETNSLDRVIDATNCTKPGQMCNGCDQVYMCIPVGSGWIIEKLDDCKTDQGFTCLESTGNCTLDHNPKCYVDVTGYEFVCHQKGLFPDAFDCQKYHLCIPEILDNSTMKESIMLTCDSGFYYNTKTGVCSKKLTSGGNCPSPVPRCDAPGQSGNIVGNAALYYICMKSETTSSYFPQMFVCGGAKEYNSTQKICVDYGPYPAGGTDGKCKEKGFFYDPTSCFYYYECTAAGVNPIRRVCPSRTHFNFKKHVCDEFTCEDLENTHNGVPILYSCSNGV